MNKVPNARKRPRITQKNPPSNEADTCHTSAVMNNRVPKTNNSGSARANRSKMSVNCLTILPSAHRVIGISA